MNSRSVSSRAMHQHASCMSFHSRSHCMSFFARCAIPRNKLLLDARDVAVVLEHHMRDQQFFLLASCNHSCFVTLSSLLPNRTERSQPVAQNPVEQGRTIFPSLLDGPVKAHIVDRDLLEAHHATCSRSSAIASVDVLHCPPLHHTVVLA